MVSESDLSHAPGRMRKSVLGVLIATVAVATMATYLGAHRYFVQLETRAASNQMQLYLRALNETLRQHQHLPFVLARDPRYSDRLQPGAVDPDINTRLARLSQEAKLEAIYLMDEEGVVLATSNAGEPNSFLGQNYGFRPYFKQALTGARSDYFAIGATSGRPGYFVAEPVGFANGTQKGVIAIKLDMSELQRAWESDRETVVALNEDGIVVLSSRPDWLYRPIADLAPDTRQAILDSRQFGTQPLAPLAWDDPRTGAILAEGDSYIAAVGQADWRNWSVIYLQPAALVTRQTLVATVLFGSIIALLVGFATFLRSRRIEQAYTVSERQRAALTKTNRQLEHAQIELARSAKLSALGALAASVTHELGQPISAFRNHLAAAEIGGEITSPTTANSLNRLVARMEAITKQFRYFARGEGQSKVVVDLTHVIHEALHLLEAETEANAITIGFPAPAEPVMVQANKVLLEQAFTNLLKNAIHAVDGLPDAQIDILLHQTSTRIEVRIRDNGPGLGATDLTDLQEPFYSTKPSGVGMGLGLSITTEIIKDHNGDLALGHPVQGAEFIVTLPVWHGGETG